MNVRPAAGYVMEVVGLDGTTRVLTNASNWNIVYSNATGRWYYHDMTPANGVDIATLVVRPI